MHLRRNQQLDHAQVTYYAQNECTQQPYVPSPLIAPQPLTKHDLPG